jgi:hypothetical protein
MGGITVEEKHQMGWRMIVYLSATMIFHTPTTGWGPSIGSAASGDGFTTVHATGAADPLSLVDVYLASRLLGVSG